MKIIDGKFLTGLLAFMAVSLFPPFVGKPLQPLKSQSFLFASEGDAIVAKVNGIPITRSEFGKLVKNYKKKAKKTTLTKEESHRLIKNLVLHQLILQQQSVQEMKSDEKIIAQVEAYRNQLLVSHFLNEKVGSKLNATDEEMLKYYEANMERFQSKEKVEARVILVKTREDAEKILERLKKGDDFSQLAKEFSLDLPSASKGGSMGLVEKERVFPEIKKVLFSLKEGEISPAVQTKYGFNIFTVDKVFQPQFESFESAKEKVKKAILMQKEAMAFSEMEVELEKNASIKIYEDRLVDQGGAP